MTGVELDPTTAAICRALYPGATVLAESFADTRVPEGHFDAAVGNVPFGRFALTDPVHNASSHSIHNHFLLKSLHLTRPGGMVALLTSRYTLDAQNPAARRELAGLGDLVFALRLPEGAHRRAAGTDAVTDLVVFRRREAGEEPAGEAFERAVRSQVANGQEAVVNEYFVAHPENVLGELYVGRGMYGEGELGVRAGGDVTDAFTRAVQRQAVAALSQARVSVPAPAPPPPARSRWCLGRLAFPSGPWSSTTTALLAWRTAHWSPTQCPAPKPASCERSAVCGTRPRHSWRPRPLLGTTRRSSRTAGRAEPPLRRVCRATGR